MRRRVFLRVWAVLFAAGCAGFACRPASAERPDIVWMAGGHAGGVSSVAFSPDGSMIASASWDKTIKLWRVSDGQLIRTLTGHSRGVDSVAFSPDGSMIASGSFDNTIKPWRVSDGALPKSYDEETGLWGVFSIAFSPDGRLFTYGRWDATVVVARNPFFQTAKPPGAFTLTVTGGTGSGTYPSGTVVPPSPLRALFSSGGRATFPARADPFSPSTTVVVNAELSVKAELALCGDMDRDGNVTVADAALALSIAVSIVQPNEVQEVAGDVAPPKALDKRVTVSDAPHVASAWGFSASTQGLG